MQSRKKLLTVQRSVRGVRGAPGETGHRRGSRQRQLWEGKGTAMMGSDPQRSWRHRLCSGHRWILVALGLLGIVTLSVVLLGVTGRKFGVSLQTTETEVKSVNRTLVAKLAALDQEEARNWKALLKVDQRVKNLSEGVKEVKAQFGEQIPKLHSTLQKLNCDLDDLKHNRTGNRRACCPKGWHLLGQSCFWVSPTKKTWEEAKLDCEEKEAHLATLTNYLELQFVFEFTKPRSTWIGLKYSGNSWKWVDGTPYNVRRIHWRPGQPSTFTTSPHATELPVCTLLYRDGLWSAEFCEFYLHWVCEMQI